jgi:hypothetical protein
MEMQQLIMEFSRSPKWTVRPSKGLPELSKDERAPFVTIPDEMLQFYELCDGLECSTRFLSIAPPDEFHWAVKWILRRSFDSQVAAFKDQREWYWYVVGCGTDQYFVVDLAPERHGHCYFTELYFFGQRGWAPIVAVSFQGLLRQLYEAANAGEDWSWNDAKLGDAYD